MIRSKTFATLALAVSVSALVATSASAQNTSFELGNLFLGFSTSGSSTPATSYLLANIGDSALDFRDATTNDINIINIGAQLTAQFGSNWANRTDLFMGAGASYGFDEFEHAPTRNGDALNTLYVTKARPIVGVEGQPAGGNLGGSPYSNSSIGAASTALYAAGGAFESQMGSVVTISNNFNSVDYDDSNPVAGTSQGFSWGGVFNDDTKDTFGTGTFGLFAGIDAEAALDLYRIAPETGVSAYEGTIIIDNVGNVSFIVAPAPVPEPSTALAFGLLVGTVALVKRRRTVVA